ncbi:hypothetical protein OG884_12100 [Streptosporangium sp. NBC_01755]|uniref:hypothetical protein n=1 Tax=Streptosporangium sp. NBC_01755 TaxID=2975949 RepID=UPI002DDC47E5|nr:hypothetical protein [Streptosporangium sp. NBC_01755]WSD02605.1 hypothetical protein OG884_12100 [Streptosporangium sp. NBC_01755]
MQGTQQRVIDDVYARLRHQLAELEQHIEQQRNRSGLAAVEAYAGMRRSCQAIRDAAADLDVMIRNF